MLDRLVSVALNFVTTPAEYQCSSTHISEEVCAAIVLGGLGGLGGLTARVVRYAQGHVPV